jgi:hypothetical protein
MLTPSNKAAAACLLALLCVGLTARAHPDENQAKSAPGWTLGASAALRALSAAQRLPSQGLPGYLLLGDPGIDHRGLALEHAVLSLGYRWPALLNAQLALGAHDRDPVHVETAWLQASQTLGSVDWTLGTGRQSPALGSVMGRAGHIDRFGSMPLAKTAVLGGDWIEDGASLGLVQQSGGLRWRLDLGLWSGRRFPGAPGSSAFASLYAAVDATSEIGRWQLDAFTAQPRPRGRGNRIANAPGGHTHSAPVCDDNLREVVCFTGHSRVAGLSLKWDAPSWPLTLSGATLWRRETGSLQSRNGLADNTSTTRGAWLEGVWRPAPRWELGLRQEALSATQKLLGPGANLVAAEAGLGAYTPQRRHTAMLGYALQPWADLRVEWGRERGAQLAQNFVALRWVVQAQR